MLAKVGRLQPEIKKVIPMKSIVECFGIAFISFIASAFIALMPMIEGYEYLFILPFAFGVLNVFFPAAWSYRKGHIGMTLFSIVLFIRYVISPVIRAMSDHYANFPGDAPTSASVQTGIWLMLYELFVTFLVIQIFAKKIYATKSKAVEKETYIPSKFILLLVVIIAIGIIVMFPSLLNKYHFFLITNEIESFATDIPMSGLLLIVIELARIIVPLLVINALKKRYDKNPSFRYVIWSIIAILPNVLIFASKSRHSVLVPALALMIVLIKLYPKYRRHIFTASITLVGVVVISITLYKQFGFTTQGNSIQQPLTPEIAAHTLDTYFSGSFNMGLAADLKNSSYSPLINTQTLVNDIFYSVAYLGQFVDQNNTSPVWFNHLIRGIPGVVDQIIPMTGQGYVYLGFILAPAFLVITLLLMMFFDNKARYENRPELVYIFSYVTIFMSMAMMLNIVVIYPVLTNLFLPFLLMFKLNRFIRIK